MPKPVVTKETKKLWNLIRKANSKIKKALKPLGKAKLKEVRNDCPVETRALKKSLAHKEVAKGGKSAKIIVGPKVSYAFVGKDGKTKIPNKYAKVVDEATGFLSNNVGPEDVEDMRKAIAAAIGQELK
jgi:phosphotransferase system IIB component